MGYNLQSSSGASIDVGNNTWILALNLAERFGWKPAGTTLDRPDWDGNYDDQAGQSVAAEDAAVFAKSLEQAATSDQFGPTVKLIAQNINGAVEEILRELQPDMLNRPEIQQNLIQHEAAEPAEFTELAAFMNTGLFTIS